jgi:hypothetical protein
MTILDKIYKILIYISILSIVVLSFLLLFFSKIFKKKSNVKPKKTYPPGIINTGGNTLPSPPVFIDCKTKATNCPSKTYVNRSCNTFGYMENGVYYKCATDSNNTKCVKPPNASRSPCPTNPLPVKLSTTKCSNFSPDRPNSKGTFDNLPTIQNITTPTNKPCIDKNNCFFTKQDAINYYNKSCKLYKYYQCNSDKGVLPYAYTGASGNSAVVYNSLDTANSDCVAYYVDKSINNKDCSTIKCTKKYGSEQIAKYNYRDSSTCVSSSKKNCMLDKDKLINPFYFSYNENGTNINITQKDGGLNPKCGPGMCPALKVVNGTPLTYPCDIDKNKTYTKTYINPSCFDPYNVYKCISQLKSSVSDFNCNSIKTSNLPACTSKEVKLFNEICNPGVLNYLLSNSKQKFCKNQNQGKNTPVCINLYDQNKPRATKYICPRGYKPSTNNKKCNQIPNK